MADLMAVEFVVLMAVEFVVLMAVGMLTVHGFATERIKPPFSRSLAARCNVKPPGVWG